LQKKTKEISENHHDSHHEVKDQNFDAIKIQTTYSNLSEAKLEILREEWLRSKLKSVRDFFNIFNLYCKFER
jgi:hypothetical protein